MARCRRSRIITGRRSRVRAANAVVCGRSIDTVWTILDRKCVVRVDPRSVDGLGVEGTTEKRFPNAKQRP